MPVTETGTRARQPDRQGYTVRAGVRLHWELFGKGDRTVFFLPTWSIIHSRHWKFQVADLARRCRVLVMDGRGNGLSDQPLGTDAYTDEEFAADALAVMDDTGTASAVLVSLSAGARWGLLLAADHPSRVEAAAFIAPALPLAPWDEFRLAVNALFDEQHDEYTDWMKYNANYWLRDHRGFLEFFFGRSFPEPHSTKPIEDTVSWGLDTTPEVLVATARQILSDQRAVELSRRVSCPVLVIHGDADEVVLHANGAALADLTGGRLLTMEESGHCPHVRDPVAVNLALREFALPAPAPSSRRRALRRRRRALYVSSPIGLGHARRDVAIAQELRKLAPDLEIDWLAQDPVTRVLEAHGERIHPASAELASESRHIELESSSHRLHVFEAWRRMDEILLSNFMVFLDAVRARDYDLWIGDEAWEVDHYLHENPELKRAAYAWLTDFVGWLPMPGFGERDVVLTADYNAEMIEHVERFPRLRDRAIFIGRPEDVVPGTFGPGLPEMRPWTERHYEFTGGYILGLNQGAVGDRGELRRRLGYSDGEVVCIVSVGGSGVGAELLAQLMKAYPTARDRVRGLRMIAVAGPRIDISTLPSVKGVEVRPFVPDLDLHLAACDIALTQGGLSTTMELTAARRPFIYFPLRDHCEQNFHVRHRLDRYRAGRCMDFDQATPSNIADTIAALVSQPVDYVEVETGTAARAAKLIAELL
ncbi:MAG TPA: alpha/beta fold hydrolase [Candidatus Limnocylindrales bacterium]|nr:alpha/beta fold hydrolase [Candidatus Limnocylindrales bacterium]